MVFLAFDMFFMIFCIIMACIIFFALFCCFPILATVAYAMTIGGGASESDIMALPKYRYCQPDTLTELDKGRMDGVKLIAKSDKSNSAAELVLHLEDSVSISASLFFVLTVLKTSFIFLSPVVLHSAIFDSCFQLKSFLILPLLESDYENHFFFTLVFNHTFSS